MCGIAGFSDASSSYNAVRLQAIVKNMTEVIHHRGPDGDGHWVDERYGVALGHRRLAIIDLSPTGRQPMFSANKRYVIVFNGEVYNYQTLRTELQALGHVFDGSSDTEVMLAAILQWGLHAAVQRFIGMFAFALWDQQEKKLFLVRDRLGIKPLYYCQIGRVFLFGSELKALAAHPAFQATVDRDALSLFVRFAYIPSPYTIYKNVWKLPPASILEIPINGDEPTVKTYWSARQVAEQGIANPFKGTSSEAVDQLDHLLRDAIGLRMIADVPLGAFLSGGIDSSVVVALMQAQSTLPVKTFTIGFREAAYNEAIYAKEVARHLSTDHTELYVTPEEAMAVIPQLADMYDEPFADSSQIPTFLVSELTRRSVTVSLSGDGGDELFGGYNRYIWGQDIWQKVGRFPVCFQRGLASALTQFSSQGWETLFEKGKFLFRGRWRQSTPADKMQKFVELLPIQSPQALYQSLVSFWKAPTDLVLGSRVLTTYLTDSSVWADMPVFQQWMMSMDLVTYLPDDILVKLDRASMAVSLEGRVPLLDHRLAEFAWSLPLGMKIHNGKGKWLLREVLYRYVPRNLLERPKTGFGVPIDSWLRGALRPWAEALLDEKLLDQQGYLASASIRQKWQEHLSGRRNWQYYLWPVLMFQAWLAKH